MYWDGLIDMNHKIEIAILVAESFDDKVKEVIKNTNKKKDIKGNNYNVDSQRSSDFK